MTTYHIWRRKASGITTLFALLVVAMLLAGCNVQSIEAQQPSATEQNKALVEQMIQEVFNEGDVDAVDVYFTADFVEHEEGAPGQDGGREGLKMALPMLRTAFPDLTVTVEDMVAEGDKVAARLTWSGTHDGDFMGMPPTGQSFSMNVMDLFRIEDGQVAEHWGVSDIMAMMSQLGMLPGPEMGDGPSDDDSAAEMNLPHELLITATGEGWDAATTIAAGWTAVTVVNESDEPRNGQLFLLAADKSAEDARAALTAAYASPPEWLTPVGGIAIVVPGDTQTVFLNLEPGSYILADPLPEFDGVLGIDKGYFMPLTVEAGETMADEPVADMTLGLADYTFDFDYDAVTAGQHTIAVHSLGATEIHEAMFVRLDEGVSVQDFLADFGPDGPQGPPRGIPVGGVSAIAPDSAAYFEVEFEAGATYGLICFLPAAEDAEHAGQPHFMLGMIGQFTVPSN